MDENTLAGLQIPDYIKRNPQLLTAYIASQQLGGTNYGLPNFTAPLDYSTTLNLTRDIQNGNNPNVINTVTPNGDSSPQPFTLNLSTNQLNDTTPSATNPQLFSDTEQLNRMANNRVNNAALNNYDQNGQVVNSNLNPVAGNFQFFNPYGGFDIPTSAFMLGQNIESNNTLGTVASGAKLGLGLARNFLSGVGFNRQNNQVMEDYRNNQRRYLTQQDNPIQYAEGGMYAEQEQATDQQEQQLLQDIAQALSEGADPQTIFEGLIESGIDEQTAQGMVQYVFQQLQGASQEESPLEEAPIMEDGGYFLSKLKGKRIKDYKLNPKTNQYEVEYE